MVNVRQARISLLLQWQHWFLALSTDTIHQVDSIKCYMDNQGIPVAEEPYIIPEFKVR